MTPQYCTVKCLIFDTAILLAIYSWKCVHIELLSGGFVSDDTVFWLDEIQSLHQFLDSD